mmetsp:Transcript_7708/g.21939  ORF Transcript_7708/g.21939 Transcript_7708/m.21939 type:complete len:332 (-) Transcript_7708:115-1110(-)
MDQRVVRDGVGLDAGNEHPLQPSLGAAHVAPPRVRVDDGGVADDVWIPASLDDPAQPGLASLRCTRLRARIHHRVASADSHFDAGCLHALQPALAQGDVRHLCASPNHKVVAHGRGLATLCLEAEKQLLGGGQIPLLRSHINGQVQLGHCGTLLRRRDAPRHAVGSVTPAASAAAGSSDGPCALGGSVGGAPHVGTRPGRLLCGGPAPGRQSMQRHRRKHEASTQRHLYRPTAAVPDAAVRAAEDEKVRDEDCEGHRADSAKGRQTRGVLASIGSKLPGGWARGCHWAWRRAAASKHFPFERRPAAASGTDVTPRAIFTCNGGDCGRCKRV